jgi:tRNA(Phe) wybutosine-synthesizing methylase Tyw3
MKEIRTSIRVSVSTKKRLRQLKGKETWDMLINRLIDTISEGRGGEQK